TLMYDIPSPIISLLELPEECDVLTMNGNSDSDDFPTTPGVYQPLNLNGVGIQPVFFKFSNCITIVAAPAAEFNSNVSGSCGAALVDFTDLSSNLPSSWQWSFEGAAPATSTEQHPQDIVYYESGSYSVQLIACNTIGCDTVTSMVQVQVAEEFTIELGDDILLCNGEQATVSALTGMMEYEWTLDGELLPGTTATLEVTVPGIYQVMV